MKRKRNRIKDNFSLENKKFHDLKESFPSINSENSIKGQQSDDEYRSIIKNPFKVQKNPFIGEDDEEYEKMKLLYDSKKIKEIKKKEKDNFEDLDDEDLEDEDRVFRKKSLMNRWKQWQEEKKLTGKNISFDWSLEARENSSKDDDNDRYQVKPGIDFNFGIILPTYEKYLDLAKERSKLNVFWTQEDERALEEEIALLFSELINFLEESVAQEDTTIFGSMFGGPAETDDEEWVTEDDKDEEWGDYLDMDINPILEFDFESDSTHSFYEKLFFWSTLLFLFWNGFFLIGCLYYCCGKDMAFFEEQPKSEIREMDRAIAIQNFAVVAFDAGFKEDDEDIEDIEGTLEDRHEISTDILYNMNEENDQYLYKLKEPLIEDYNKLKRLYFKMLSSSCKKPTYIQLEYLKNLEENSLILKNQRHLHSSFYVKIEDFDLFKLNKDIYLSVDNSKIKMRYLNVSDK